MDVMNTLFDGESLAVSGIVCLTMAFSLVLCMKYRDRIHITSQAEKTKYQNGRKLSPFESMMYELNNFGVELNCYLAFVESRVPLSLDLLERAAKVLQNRHPLLRMKIIEDSDSNGASQYFIPMSDPTVDVDEVKVDNWEDLLAMETKTHFRLSTGPIWRFRLVKTDEQQMSESGLFRNTLATTFSHTIIDGNCIMRILNELMDVLSDLSNDNEVDMTSWPLLPGQEELFHIGEFPWWKKILIKLYSKVEGLLKSKKKPVNPYIECFQAEIAKNPTVVKETRALSIELTAEEMQKLRQNCRHHGATVNGATTAAASIAVCKIMQGGKLNKDQKIDTNVMVNMRKFCNPPLDPGRSVGLFCSMLNLGVTVPMGGDSLDEFWKLAAWCTRKTREKCEDNCKEGRKVLELLAMVKNILKLSLFDVLADFVGDKQNGSRAKEVFMISNLGDCSYFTKDKPRNFELVRKISAGGGFKYEPAFSHYIATVHGKMFWSLAYHTNVCTKTQAEEYADGIDEILKKAIQ